MWLLILSALAEPVAVPNSGVALDPPAGFVAAERFQGFSDGGPGSILVTELPVAAETMRGELTAEALASRQMIEVERLTATNGQIVHVHQTQAGITFDKYMLILGDDEKTAMIVGTLPQDDPRTPALIASLGTATYSSAAPESGKPFIALTPIPPYAPSIEVQNMQLFSPDGVAPPLPDGTPTFLVGPSMHPVDLSSLDVFATTRVRQFPFTDLDLQTSAAVDHSGRPAWEITARARNAVGKKIALYQLVIAEPDGNYTLALGTGRKKDLSDFRAMATSIRLD